MSKNRKEFNAMRKTLEDNFLYRNDEDSLQILLSLFENEYRVHRLTPKYTCMPAIKRSVRRVLRILGIRHHEVMQSVCSMLNDVVNRLEFAVYLEAYTAGLKDTEWANQLEERALAYIPFEDLFHRKTLFHSRLNTDILVLKNQLMDAIDASDAYHQLGHRTTKYSERVIHPKILKINTYADKQLMLWQDDELGEYGFSEPAIIVRKDLDRIYERLVRAFLKSIQKLYKEAYWYGVNDRVLNRY